MKKLLLLATVFFIAFTSGTMTAKGQCANDFVETCKERTASGQYLDSYVVQLEQQGQGETLPVRKYDVVFSSGKKYKISIFDSPGFSGKIIASLHLGDKFIDSTYDVDSKEHKSYLHFECRQSGNYSLTFYFEDGQKGCAVGIITIE